MIRKVRIQNFKSLRDVSIDLGRFTVFVGANGSGVHQRTWLGESTVGHGLTWKKIGKLALNAGITVEGHFDGKSGLADAAAARWAILFLRALSGGNLDRERRCWLETPLPTLRERGAENGLAAYLKEIQERLATLIGHPS